MLTDGFLFFLFLQLLISIMRQPNSPVCYWTLFTWMLKLAFALVLYDWEAQGWHAWRPGILHWQLRAGQTMLKLRALLERQWVWCDLLVMGYTLCDSHTHQSHWHCQGQTAVLNLWLLDSGSGGPGSLHLYRAPGECYHCWPGNSTLETTSSRTNGY